MGKSVFIYVMLGIVTAPAFASDLACDDLYAVTCAPGKFDDGTGVISNPSDALNKTNQVTKKASEESLAQVRSDLKKPENVYLRQMALAGTLSRGNPACENAEKSPSDECLDIMADATNTLLMQTVSISQGTYFIPGSAPPAAGPEAVPHASLADRAFLVSSANFQLWKTNVLAAMDKENQGDVSENRVRTVIFPQVKKLLIDKISELYADSPLKDNLVEKVRAIQFAGSDCTALGADKNSASGVFFGNAFYNSSANDFHYCRGMTTQGRSDFALAFWVGHELSHSIDPCNISNGPSTYVLNYKRAARQADLDKQYPLSGVVNCLRTDKSVAAKQIPPQQMNYGSVGLGSPMPIPSVPPNGMVAYNGMNVQVPNQQLGRNQFVYSGSGRVPMCENDQITESFADWMGSQLLPEFIEKNYPTLSAKQLRNGYSNVFRALPYSQCFESAYPNDTHPASLLRVNNAIDVQPRIRSQMQCPQLSGDRIYCDQNFKPDQPKGLHYNEVMPVMPTSKALHD